MLDRGSFLASASAIAIVAGPLRALGEAAPLQFDFRSSFWLNLHHRLYRQADVVAWERAGHPLEREQPSRWKTAAMALMADAASLPAAQREEWDAAVMAYVEGGYTDRDLLLDDGMTAIKEALGAVPGEQQPPQSRGLPEKLRTALMAAAPVYRSSLWPADDASNVQWIANVRPRVADFGSELTQRLRRLYGWDWPIGPYRVDVVRYANFLGAYTTTGPIHIVISSGDPNYSGMAGLEMTYHEASHAVVTPDYCTVGTAIENAATRLGKNEPDGLWHAVIFFTVGSVLAEMLRSRRNEDYTMYADVAGVFSGAWKPYRAALAAHWQPYIDGSGSLEAALAAVVGALPA